MTAKKTVVVVGGGFAGINVVKHLDSNQYNVLLIDKLNHHQFQPLFYQVATSQIEPSSISFPLRHIFRGKKNVQIRLAEVFSVNPEQKSLDTSIGTIAFDYLILSMGCKTNFFGNKSIEKEAYTLKTTYDAITIRNHILETFEQVITASEEEKEALLNLVIVGAGPTGVELAGAFTEIKKHVLPLDYPNIDFSKLNIILIEGSKNTLNAMSEKSKLASKAYLQKMGVDIRTESLVTDYKDNILYLKDGTQIKTKTLIWSAGVIANTINGLSEKHVAPGNRLRVNRINQLEGENAIFVLGDQAYMETPNYPKGHPQLANVAINQAKLLAKNLNRMALGKTTQEYEYKDLGTMATIGRNKAVVDLPFYKFKGFFAWVFWMLLHLMLILSVRNKLIIFINWAWAYVTKNTALRLIIQANKTENTN